MGHGARQELAAAPDCPAGLEYLWGWFLRLHSTRPPGFGVSAISEQEIGWFFRNRGIQPESWEIDLIAQLDALALELAADEPAKKT